MVSGSFADGCVPSGDHHRLSKLIGEREDERQHSTSVVGPDHLDSLRLTVSRTVLIGPETGWLREELRRPLPHSLGIEVSQAVPPEMLKSTFALQ
jgi:hypothetical protein